MRILSVTETYAPFLEFGGPPVKVRALAQGLAEHGNESHGAYGGLGRRGTSEMQRKRPTRSGVPSDGNRVGERRDGDLLADLAAVPLATWNPAVTAILPDAAARF